VPKGATKVISFVLDPEYNIFRKFSRNELAPCLGMVLSDQRLLIVCPSKGAPDENILYQKIAGRVASTKQTMIKADKDVTESDLKQNSLLLLGDPKINGITEKLLAMLPAVPDNIKIRSSTFDISGVLYQESKYALMFSERNPQNADKYLTLFFGLSPVAAEQARWTRYRWDQYAIFSAGLMSQKGDFIPPFNALEYRFSDERR
jgi:hypothetical protein